MHYIIIQSKMASNGGACDSCCCEHISMVPGETDLVLLNYMHWSMPLAQGGPGVVPTFSFELKHDEEGCATGSIDGFSEPINQFLAEVDVAAGTPVVVDLSATQTPAANDFTYDILGIHGPSNGQASISGSSITYIMNNGFQGHDVVWYKVTDAQGRSFIASVTFSSEDATGQPPMEMRTSGPRIDYSEIEVNQSNQTVQFPITMSPACRSCDSYRLTIKQPARNCEGKTFHHVSCYDITCRNCN